MRSVHPVPPTIDAYESLRTVDRGRSIRVSTGQQTRSVIEMSDGKRESTEGLSEPLSERGFRPVETDLPGDWASNVEMSIQITSKRDVDRRRTYVARVYNAPADSLEIPRVQLLAESQSDDHVEATRFALEGAEKRVQRS